MSWYLAVLKNYAGFSGRARRKEYWMFTLINFIIAAVLYAIFLATRSTVVDILLIVYFLGVLIPGIAVTVRRLHDTGRTGAWYFIAFVPFIGGIWLLVLTILEGNSGPNEYGADPKAVPVPAV